MVKKILSFVGREIAGLHEAAYLLAASAVASLVFALVRDRLLAHVLGASSTLDVYYAAFRVPDFIFVTAASLVSTSILVPFLIDAKQKGKEELRASIANLFSGFLFFILLVCAAAFVFMKPLQEMLFPNLFDLGLGGDLVTASRILLLSPILLGLAGFFASITQIQNRFLLYALSAPLYNVGIIVGIVFFLPSLGIKGLALGVALGALLLSVAQMPLVIKDGLFPRLRLRLSWSEIRRVGKLSVPRAITLSSQQLSTLSLVSFASFLGAGSISIFNFALNLQSVPLSVIGASYSSAAFPVLSHLIAAGDREGFLQKMISAARHIIFWTVPATVLFIILRAQVVRTVLGSGAFSWSDTRLTAAALALFVVSTAAQCLMLLFVRSFYAEGKTAKPLVINLIAMAFTAVSAAGLLFVESHCPTFRYFFDSLLKVGGAADTRVLMLPLAFSLGALFNLFLHWRAFAKEFKGFSAALARSSFVSFGASVVGGYVGYFSLRFFDDVFDLSTSTGIFLQGLCAGLIAIAMIVLVLSALKSPELTDIARTWKK